MLLGAEVRRNARRKTTVHGFVALTDFVESVRVEGTKIEFFRVEGCGVSDVDVWPKPSPPTFF